MSTVNMKLIQKYVDAAAATFAAWKPAGTYALTQHAGYLAALKTNAAARTASAELRGYVTTTIAGLQQDPATDPSWYQKLEPIRKWADYQVQTLDKAKALVLADLAAHMKIAFSPAEAGKFAGASPETAAAAVDAKAKSQDPYQNRKTPEKQDASQPPADVPPGHEEPSRWPLFAGAAAAGAILLKLLRVW